MRPPLHLNYRVGAYAGTPSIVAYVAQPSINGLRQIGPSIAEVLAGMCPVVPPGVTNP